MKKILKNKSKIHQDTRLPEHQLHLRAMLTSNLSHEIKTPIHTMIALTSVLLTQGDGELNADQLKILNKISQQGNSLLKTIESLIDYSKLADPERLPAFTRIPVKSLFQKIINSLKVEGELKGILVQYEIKDLPDIIYHDEILLAHILTELGGNAIKFSNHDTQIKITIKYKNSLIITVEDQGIGIDDELISLIFDGFIQGEYEANRTYGGLGLGLSIAKRAVDIIGGELTLDSNENGGTTVSVTLPLHSQITTTRVLVVDDESMVRTTLVNLLRANGLEADEAKHGKDALEKVAYLKPDALVLDIVMPGMDGFAVLESLRASPWGKDIPIILISALDGADERSKGFALGADDYIVKPFGVQEVISRLEYALERRNLKDAKI